MTTPIPAPLKVADISRFALRAAQLEKFKPVVAYWCDYYIVQKILQKGLHTESDECMTYTTNLMDKLEKWKADNAGNDAVHDDVAAQAYVEQFALETFERAEKAVRANQVKAPTADTYQAAATFLDLLNIWQNPLDQDIAAKSKYAKFHALRIAKAVKAGEDPNLSNPQTAPPEPPLDPNDPEVRQIQSLRPTVEDGSDTSRPISLNDPSQLPLPTAQSHSPNLISPVQPPLPQPTAPTQYDVSPLDPSPKNDGYFPTIPPPQVPTFTADTSPIVPGPIDETMTSPPPIAPVVSPQDFYTTNSPPQAPPSIHSPIHPPIPPPSLPRAPSHPQLPSPQMPTPQTQIPAPFSPPQPTFHQQPQPLFQPQPPQQQFVSGNYRRDDEAVIAAQKHAKWAISALNFEDVDTAVKELRIALQSLGAG